MASLRARLLAGVLALSAAGLLLLGGITYGEQRSFQLTRVDQQVRAAFGPVAAGFDGHRPGPGGPFRGGPGDDHHDVGLPSGTYGQLRSPAGAVITDTVLGNGQTITARPKLPASIRVGHIFTVEGKKGAGTRYRVLASPDRDDGLVIVVAVPMRDVDGTLHRLLAVEALVIAGVLLLIGLVGWLVVRVGLRPLDRMGLTAGAIAGGDLSHRVETTDPRTEVGRLGQALNAMLDRLEAAFAQRRASEDRLRQFLADASHELRTPLTSIRGYAELFRTGAGRDPAEAEKSMRRIEEEAARMGVLVEDLLALARLDETRDAPHIDVDVAALARDAADDARATAPDRVITCRADERAGVRGDPHQLRQVLGNLVRNALVHTPAGSPVDLTVTNGGGEVRLEVRDHGAGLPKGVEPRTMFERFWRAEGGRERGRGGAGLGLAIVAGIVAAHDGRVEAANAAGGGAAFTVRLPAA